MSEVKILYHGLKTIIEYESNEKMKEIFEKFKTKINMRDKEIVYQYNGKIIKDENIVISQLTSEKIFTILAYDSKDYNVLTPNGGNLINSDYVICPKCKKSAILEEKDYKLIIYGCQNDHITNNILINDFNNLQEIDYSKIMCQQCHQSYIYNNEFYQCNKCKIDLCPSCKSSHDNNHKIINYNDKEFICDIHNEQYNSYCNKCKKNICILCENNHNDHDLVYYGKLAIEESQIIKKLAEIKKEIDIFNDNIKEKIRKLNKIIENIDEYYKIINNIIQNYINDKKRNYQILINIDKIINNNDIINKIKIINNNNEYNDIISIYNKIYNIKDNNIIDKNNKFYNNNDISNITDTNIEESIIVYKMDKNNDRIKIFGKVFVDNNKNIIKMK